MIAGEQAQIGNVDLVEQLNNAAAYRPIGQYGPISHIQIAEQDQLAPVSATKIAHQLIKCGLIKEVDQQTSAGGRRVISIIVETRNFNATGVRLGHYDATLTPYDLSSKALEEERSPPPERTQETLEYVLLNIIATFIENCQRKTRGLIAISVILPGLVSPENGVIRCIPRITVRNWGLVGALGRHSNVTCYVRHDIRSLVLAEYYFDASQDCEGSILVRVHCGTDTGIISDGRISTGRNGNVGEIGHIQVDPPGERYRYSNFGHLEIVTANATIEQQVRYLLEQDYRGRLAPNDCMIKAICKAASKGDALACEVIKCVGHHLGKMIVTAINLSNPQKIVIVDEIVEAEKVLFPAIEDYANAQALKAFRKNLPVVRPTLDHRSAIGAFALVKRIILSGTLL